MNFCNRVSMLLALRVTTRISRYLSRLLAAPCKDFERRISSRYDPTTLPRLRYREERLERLTAAKPFAPNQKVVTTPRRVLPVKYSTFRINARKEKLLTARCDNRPLSKQRPANYILYFIFPYLLMSSGQTSRVERCTRKNI